MRALSHKFGELPGLLAVGGGIAMAMSWIVLLFTRPSAAVSLGMVGGSMLAVVVGIALLLLGAAVMNAEEREKQHQTDDDN